MVGASAAARTGSLRGPAPSPNADGEYQQRHEQRCANGDTGGRMHL